MLTEQSSTGALPISLDEAMQDLRVVNRDSGTHLLRHVERAMRYVEREAQITLRPNVQYLLSLPNWPTYDGDDSYRQHYGSQTDGSTRDWNDGHRVGAPIHLARPPCNPLIP